MAAARTVCAVVVVAGLLAVPTPQATSASASRVATVAWGDVPGSTPEGSVLPLYYKRPNEFAEVRRAALSLNGSFFNTHRMVREYVDRAYLVRSP